jgi:predicted MFS family arabinose efflux permease
MSQKIKSGIAAYCAVFGIGYMGYMLMPALLAPIIEQLAINEAQAGFAATMQLGGLALGLFATTPFLARIRIRSLILLGAVLATTGFTLTAATDSYEGVLLGLGSGGIGMGMVLAGGNTLVASSGNPDRLFATIFAFGQATAIIILIAVLPTTVGKFGYQGGFGAVALWTAILCVILFFTAPSNGKEKRENRATSSSLMIFFTPAVLALLMLGLADASVWPFSQQIGSSLGLGSGVAESVLAAALAAGVSGSLVSAWLGLRFGRTFPMATGVVTLACCYFFVLTASEAWVYAVAQIAVLFAYGFSVPYFFGLCGKLDSTGRYMAAAAGMQMVGLALAPWLAGSLIVKSGYSALGLAVVFSAVLALILGLISARKTNSDTGMTS